MTGTAQSDVVTLHDGRPLHVHTADRCVPPCAVHAPSDHHMRGWPLHWRGDRQMLERLCPCGIGHPDPDQLVSQDMSGVHGCCGHCRPCGLTYDETGFTPVGDE